MTMKQARSYRETLLARLSNLDEAAAYLQAAYEDYKTDGEIGVFLLAMRDVIDARGGMTETAGAMGVSRNSLYKSISENGNPYLETAFKTLDALGLEFLVAAKENVKTNHNHG